MPIKQRIWVQSTFTSPAIKQSSGGGAYALVQNGITYDTWTGVNETINTVSGNDGSFNPVEHVKKRIDIPGFNLNKVTVDFNAPGKVRTNEIHKGYAQNGWRLANAMTGAGDLTTYNCDWNALAAQATAVMLPSLTQSDNLINYLIELKDFKRLGQSILKRASALKLLQEAFGFKPKDSLVKNSARGYLSYMFAWRPLLNETTSLLNNALAYQKRVEELVKRANTPQQRYYGTNLTSASSNRSIASGTAGGGLFGGFSPHTKWWIEEYGAAPARYTATMRFKYTMSTELINKAKGIAGLLDVLGVNANPGTIWEAIPFSFIVDWIVNVGQYLDRLRVDNIDVRSTTEILDFCHSVKAERKYRFQVDCVNKVGSSYVAENKRTDYATGVVSYYRRIRTLPNIYGALTTSGLSGNEILLSGALITARYK